MRPRNAANDPESGFSKLRTRDRFWMVAAAFEPALSRIGLAEPGGFERALATRLGAGGRRPTSILSLAAPALRIHVRPVVHGGWLGALLRASLLGLERPIAELRVAAALAAAGAPVADPAFAIARRVGPFWNAAVGSVFQEDTVDGRSFLAGSPDRAQLLRAAEAAGRAIRRFHDAGGSHPDLHVGNLLLRIGIDGAEVIVIDLDRVTRHSAISPRRRMRELMRLQRSLVKRGWVETIGPRGYARFWAAYTAGDRRLRAELKKSWRREQLRIAIHSLGYR